MRELLGIAFKEDSITITHLKNSLSGMRALSSAMFPFKSDDEIISAIREHLSRRGIRNGRIFVSIPDKWAIIKFTELPLTRERGRDALSQLMRYEIERHIPFQIDDVNYDFKIVDERDTAVKVVFAAVPKGKLDAVNEFLQKFSLSPDVITISSFAVLNAMEMSGVSIGGWREVAGIAGKSDLFKKKEQVNVSLYIHETEAYMAVIRNGSCIYLQSFLIDENKPLQSFVDDIALYMTNILAEISAAGFNNLFLAGGASMPGIEDALKEKLGINIIPVNMLDTLKGPEMTGIAASVGAALSGLGIGSYRINMLKHKADYETSKTAAVLAKILTVMILFIVLGIFATGAGKEKKYLQSVEDELKKNEPQVKALEKLSSDINTFKIHRDFMFNVKKEDVALEVLREVTNVLPSDTWITNLDYKGVSSEGEKKTDGEIVISGFSASSSKLISLLEDSPFFEQVVFVGPIRKVMEKEGFKLKAYLVSPEKRAMTDVSSITDMQPVVKERKGQDETAN
ncbi:MAG: pilus assembly protein PilM [Nitrospirae bacterium]|nr:pilus assembly protein PilM [Nitrospirota bacterium]